MKIRNTVLTGLKIYITENLISTADSANLFDIPNEYPIRFVLLKVKKCHLAAVKYYRMEILHSYNTYVLF